MQKRNKGAGRTAVAGRTMGSGRAKKLPPLFEDGLGDGVLRVDRKKIGAKKAYGWFIKPEAGTVEFSLDGVRYSGLAGDTVASALFANDEKLFGSSLLYHRPRSSILERRYDDHGFVSYGNPAHYGFAPAVPAHGLLVRPQMKLRRSRYYNNFSAVDFGYRWGNGVVTNGVDREFSLGVFAKFFGKNFSNTMDGAGALLLRKNLGLGKAPSAVPDLETTGITHPAGDVAMHEVDILLVGSHRAGVYALSSLLKKLPKNISIAIVSDDPEAAGEHYFPKKLLSDKRCRWFFNTTMAHVYPILAEGKTLGVKAMAVRKKNNGEQQNIFYARSVVLAMGRREESLPFINNDLPGVMSFRKAMGLLYHYGVLAGRRVTVITNNDSVYYQLADLQKAGVAISAVVDIRKEISPDIEILTEELGVTVYRGHYPKKAHHLYDGFFSSALPAVLPPPLRGMWRGMGRLVWRDAPRTTSLSTIADWQEKENGAVKNGATMAVESNDEWLVRHVAGVEVNDDAILVSGGFQPRLEFFCQMIPASEGEYLTWSEELQSYLPYRFPPCCFLVGAVGGCFNDTAMLGKMADEVAKDVALLLAGKATAENISKKDRRHHHHGFAIFPHRFLPDNPTLSPSSFLDQQYDVTFGDFLKSFKQGYHSPLSLKHHSKVGFGDRHGQGILPQGLAYVYGKEMTLPDNKNIMGEVIRETNVFDELHGLATGVVLNNFVTTPKSQSAVAGIKIARRSSLAPFTERPKKFGVLLHPNNNTSNDHGAMMMERFNSLIPHYYPYHVGDDAVVAGDEEKQKLALDPAVGFCDRADLAVLTLLGKGAVGFLEFISATKLPTTKLGGTGVVTIVNPSSGLVMAMGRYVINSEESVLLTLPSYLPHGYGGRAMAVMTDIARQYKKGVAVVDSRDSVGIIRLVGRAVPLLMMALFHDDWLVKNIAGMMKNKKGRLQELFDVKQTLSPEEKNKLLWAGRYDWVDRFPLMSGRAIVWRDMTMLVLRRYQQPDYYAGGAIGDVEIFCDASEAVSLYKELWQLVVGEGEDDLNRIFSLFGLNSFAFGNLALDYWRIIRGEAGHGLVSENNGTASLYDMRCDDKMSVKKFLAQDLARREHLKNMRMTERQKLRQRLCGFIAIPDRVGDDNRDGWQGLATKKRVFMRAGNIVLEADKEPLAQGHGIGKITTASYCPIKKTFVGLGFVSSLIDAWSGKVKDPFGTEVIIADPLSQHYQRALVVPYQDIGKPEKKEG